MPIARKPLLCLDTNASIDIGVVNNLERTGESLDAQSRKITESWKNVFYDEVMEARITKILQDRHDQLRGSARFLHMARDRSVIRLPEFGKIEHARVKSDAGSIPPFPVEKITHDVHRISLEVFSTTTLSLQDSLILASAIGMRADALVSNDDDFKRAFSGDAKLAALRIVGKPLLLLDHREPVEFEGEKQPTLYSMLLQSLRRYYGTHPRFGRPLWIDRIGGKRNWYLAYHHPLPAERMEPSLVPGRDSISIIDEHSWTVCKIESVYFLDESYPEGITRESIKKTQRNHSSIHRPKNLERYFRLPESGKPGYIRVAIELDGFPQPWKNWSVSSGERSDTKRNAPKNARGFVEIDPPVSSGDV